MRGDSEGCFDEKIPVPGFLNCYKTIKRFQKFDYSFEIETSTGKSFALNFNVGEDPNFAAQRCCEENKLPVAFVPQLLNHLQTNVPELSGMQGQVYADPFTGGSRFVPASGAGAQNAAADFGEWL